MTEVAHTRPTDKPASAQIAETRIPKIRRVNNRDILLTVLGGLLQRSVHAPRSLRRELLKNLWIELKRFSAPNIRTVELSELVATGAPLVEGEVRRFCPLVLVALSRVYGCRTIFEIGTYRGETTWLLAHNNPAARIFTLDLPGLHAVGAARLELTDLEYFDRWERGQRFLGTAESARITQLHGDSATFDFASYAGQMDLVYIDASHSYSYVRSDTEAALKMLAPTGMIVWDDYTYYPGIFAYLNELSPSLSRPIEHIGGTRFAIYRGAAAIGTNA